MKSHVTIYLEPPILQEGGAVIVSGVPVTDDVWQKIPKGNNPAADDHQNPKREQVGPQDRLLGAVASSPVTIVEFSYPQSGSYTFNFLPAKPYQREFGATLRTELILTGSGSRMVDPETKKHIEWPSMETIAVIGTKYNQDWARVVDATFASALYEDLVIARYEGVRTIALTPEQIRRYVVEPK